MNSRSFVITNLKEAVTFAPLVKERRFHSIQTSDLGLLKNAWIAVDQGKIIGVGTGEIPTSFTHLKKIDGSNSIAIPGLIDAHTHPVFSGIRATEFCMRLDGATYQEIAAAGGGIKSSVTKTRQASSEELDQLLTKHIHDFSRNGVTTVEVKTGYGLSVSEEIRHLRIIQKVQSTSPVTLIPTCLALHAVPPEESSAASWAKRCAEELLPVVKNENLAHGVDAFIENGYFSTEDVAHYLDKAQELGLAIRLHADEFSDAGAALCAAQYQALSADHLQFANSESIAAMAKAGVVAILLPGTSLYTGIPFTQAEVFRDHKCPMALATDFNPGSCVINNIRHILTMGALHCKLTMAEAIAAITWVPARSLRLEHAKGAIAPGYDADILLMPLESCAEFVADVGQTKPRAVYAQGVLLET